MFNSIEVTILLSDDRNIYETQRGIFKFVCTSMEQVVSYHIRTSIIRFHDKSWVRVASHTVRHMTTQVNTVFYGRDMQPLYSYLCVALAQFKAQI